MSHDVFVSYPSTDKTTADAVVATLESHGLRCWYAPRDVAPGADWAGSIVHAIGASRMTILVFSEAANNSEHIMREVRQAADARTPILPFRISPEEPSESLRYYIGGTHWLDALTPPLEEHLEQLVETAKRIIAGAPPDELVAPHISAGVPPEARVTTAPGTPQSAHRLPTRRHLVLGLVVAMVLAAVAALAVVAARGLGSGTNDAATVPTATSNPNTTEDTEAETSDPSEGDGAWRPLSFITADPQLWAVSGDDRLTALEQSDFDAFAWSTETVDGDLAVRFDLESPGPESSGCVIIYGGGQHFHVQGSLIFCVEWDFFTLEKHTTVHSGENFVTYTPSNLDFARDAYEVEIEILGDVASMSVDGSKVLSTVFDPEEIREGGRIGLHKKPWIGPEVTFSNIEVRTPSDALHPVEGETEDEFDCELDTGTDLNHFPISSAYISHSVDVDGAITSPAEWADAQCVDARMHFGINVTNPEFQQARWWIQNDDEAIFFLARIPIRLGFDAAFVNYFWPEIVDGFWPHNDAVSVDADGVASDAGQWDEVQFYDDLEMDPPGTFDTVAAVTEDAEFVWIELRHPLDSGDGYDWVFEPGRTYGNNPYDSVMVGVVMDEGTFLRYLRLKIGES